MHAAVDIVLLPPAEITHHIIALNQSLVGPDCDQLRLDMAGLLPHISLAMGIVAVAERDALIERLQQTIAKRAEPGVALKGLHVRERASKPTIASIVLDNASSVQQLHEHMLTHVLPKPAAKATAQHFSQRETVGASSVNYVASFRKQFSRASFWPHITLGYGIPSATLEAQEVRGYKLALVQLGNHCTCHVEDVWWSSGW